MSDARTPNRPWWFRFSLRTLALAITGLCIWFGILAARAHRQHAAVTAIRAAGGTIVSDYQNESKEPPGPTWLRRLIGDDFFCSPTYVMVAGDSATDELIEQHISALSRLQVLGIGSTKVTDKSLSYIAQLSELRELVLNCPQITAAGLQQLANLTSLVSVHSFRSHPDEPGWDRLDNHVWVNVDDAPVAFVLQHLTDKCHISFRIDPAPRPWPPEQSVTLKINNMSLGATLKQMIQKCNLDYVANFDAEVIAIVPPETAQEKWPAWSMLRKLFPDAIEVHTDW
ncbi:MAG TPA: hypothetical protein VKH44_07790 [Pirellulaceae bacterium]|nr:hypothetical protein [Pirellulaceae bacterium]